MTWAALSNKLVDLVEAATVSGAGAEMGDFRHAADGFGEEYRADRTFVIRHVGGALNLRMENSGNRRWFRDVDVLVYYTHSTDETRLDQVIGDDHAAIVNALLDGDLDFATTGGVALQQGGDEGLSFEIEDLENGDRLLIIHFAAEHE